MHTASIYSGDSHQQPLLEKKAQTTTNTFPRLRSASLALGLMVGFLIQFSTLGANCLVIAIWGENVLSTISQRDIVLFSFLWSLATSSVAMLVMTVLRYRFSTAYNYHHDKKDNHYDDIVLHLEFCFVVGALVGARTAWTVTDAVLGLSVQIVYAMATMVVALSCCRFTMWMFSSSPSLSTPLTLPNERHAAGIQIV